ncbi:unnamed protein product [Spirodela intermedia]|uniref:GTD-binding domain-containing protein n=1 Tax=Spirodela intermedia TaxID=51605 RepID=A0A7I8KF60_SPIIN|nr:unnamed protein product [Spirodela intermedia]
MSCHMINRWTFSGLVGAFLDLALAWFMLCGATVAFLTTKLLELFGQRLPCPCQGLFGRPDEQCLQEMLALYPPRKISHVQMSLRRRFPFSPAWPLEEGTSCHFDVCRDEAQNDEVLETAGEEASVSNWNNVNGHRLSYGDSPSVDKGDGLLHAVLSSIHDMNNSDLSGKIESSARGEVDALSVGSIKQLTRCGATENDSVSGVLAENRCKEGGISAIRILEQALEEEQVARSSLYLELEKERSAAATAADEAMAMILRLQKEKASIEMEARQYERIVEERTAYDEEEMNILKEIIVRRERENHVLEKEVELYRQMILSGDGSQQQPSDELHDVIKMTGVRLNYSFEFDRDTEIPQDSKFATEGRMVDSDSGHLGNLLHTANLTENDGGPPDCVTHGSGNRYITPLARDEEGKCSRTGDEQPSGALVEDICCLSPCYDTLSHSSEIHGQKKSGASLELPTDAQEKGILAGDLCASWQSQAFGSHPLDTSEDISHNEAHVSLNKVEKTDFDGSGWLPRDEAGQDNQLDGDGRGFNICDAHLESEPAVLDVHITDEEMNIAGNRHANCFSQVARGSDNSICDAFSKPDGGRKVDLTRRYSGSTCLEADRNVRRSISGSRRALLPVNMSCDSFSLSNLRRNSMSAVDRERSKLEAEVEFLRDRLRIIQDGREKLNLSEHKEKENCQLKLLEEIVSQLCAIRKLARPGKPISQVSSDSPTSKV